MATSISYNVLPIYVIFSMLYKMNEMFYSIIKKKSLIFKHRNV